jgi:ABC-2 type transport system ATP-binding protein
MDAAIELRNVTKTFGQTAAVKDLNLTIPYGGLYGFIGPNGAGKTTTIRLILSIFFPDSGEISVLGYKSALQARNRIGYLPEERGVYRKMRVGAFLSYIAGLKGVKALNLDKTVRASLERVGLGGTEGKRCEELSKGMLQKVQLLAAVIHKPDLLILDEPFSGLDPVSTRQLRDLVLEETRRGATILFSTHVMPQAEEICQNVIMIHRGRKVLDEALATIRSQYDPRILEFDPLDSRADLSILAKLPGVERVEPDDSGYKIFLVDGGNHAEAMHRIIDAATPARLELSRPRLEDIFISLVSTGADTVEDRQKLRANLKNSGTGEVSA